MEKYSELLHDHLLETANFKDNGESTFEKGLYGYLREDYEIKTIALSKKYKKPIGRYSLLTLKHVLLDNETADNYYLKKLTNTLKSHLPKITKDSCVLVVGLGNRHISSDSLGTEVVKNINVTRNLSADVPQVCAIAPGVLGLTGIESADIINGVVDKVKPDLIIMIDSLCASHVSRLGVSFQISNTPITPGSGINNTRKKIKNNVPTISIGVPLVVYANTFIKSAISDCDIQISKVKDKNLKDKLNCLINNQYNELVTLSEIEYAVRKIGRMIATSINLMTKI